MGTNLLRFLRDFCKDWIHVLGRKVFYNFTRKNLNLPCTRCRPDNPWYSSSSSFLSL